MKKKIIALLLLGAVACQLVACSFEPKCKEKDCDKTDIYEDGYCKKHYYQNEVGDFVKDPNGYLNEKFN